MSKRQIVNVKLIATGSILPNLHYSINAIHWCTVRGDVDLTNEVMLKNEFSDIESSSSKAITSLYQKLNPLSNTKYSGPIVLGWEDESNLEASLEDVQFRPFVIKVDKFKIHIISLGISKNADIDGAGIGYMSSFIGKYKKQRSMFVQKIDQDGCHIDIYEKNIKIESFVGLTPVENQNTIIELNVALKNLYPTGHVFNQCEIEAWQPMLKATGCTKISPFEKNQSMCEFWTQAFDPSNDKITLKCYMKTNFSTQILLMSLVQAMNFVHGKISAERIPSPLRYIFQWFKILAEIALEKKFEERKIGLTLHFEQEQRWRFSVNFIFDCINQQNGDFVFKPTTNGQDNNENELQNNKFFHSTILRKPTLWKVTYNDNVNNDNDKEDEKSQAYVNLLQKSCQLSIKSRNQTFQKIQNVYRIGNGSNHLKVPYKFTYSTKDNDSNEVNRLRSRGGDRIMNPLSFECSPSFFYPQESTAHRLLMSITKHKPILRQSLKLSSTKKSIIATSTTNSTIPPPSPRNFTYSPPFQSETNPSRLEEKKILFKIPSKWARGPR
nr:15500_t:CDS:2 [Entrophospora candida]